MHNVEHLDESPAIIVPCLHGRAPDNSDISSGFFSSTYPAVQNILLAARSRGLGTVLLTLATDYTPVRPEATAESARRAGPARGRDDHGAHPGGLPEGSVGPPLAQAVAGLHALGPVGRLGVTSSELAP